MDELQSSDCRTHLSMHVCRYVCTYEFAFCVLVGQLVCMFVSIVNLDTNVNTILNL